MSLEVVVFALLLCGANAVATCKGNAQLSVYTQPIEKQGITFDKLAVNRSVPAQVVYSIEGKELNVESVAWKHNNDPIKIEEGPNKEVYYTIDQSQTALTVTLHLPQPTSRVTGNWTLILRTSDSVDHTGVCFVQSSSIIHQKLGAVRANEGEALSVTCDVESYPLPLEIVWKKLQESDTGTTLVPVANATFESKDEVRNAIMTWADASGSSGFYMCTAKSRYAVDNLVFEVRIKGKLDYLWPCIGIILELLVLMITIVIYERAQSKRRKAEQGNLLDKPDK